MRVSDARCPPMQMIYEWNRLSELVSLRTQTVIVLRITELRMRLFSIDVRKATVGVAKQNRRI